MPRNPKWGAEENWEKMSTDRPTSKEERERKDKIRYGKRKGEMLVRHEGI